MNSNRLLEIINLLGITLWATISISLFVLVMFVTIYLEEKSARKANTRKITVENEKNEIFQQLYVLAERGDKASEETLRLLPSLFEECNPAFIHKIHSLCNLQINDMRLCMLVRLGFTSKQISGLLVMETNTVYHAKCRIYQRLTGKQGKSKDLDCLLSTL